jgi:hypothetical protein
MMRYDGCWQPRTVLWPEMKHRMQGLDQADAWAEDAFADAQLGYVRQITRLVQLARVLGSPTQHLAAGDRQ